jgi:hypothetical protein
MLEGREMLNASMEKTFKDSTLLHIVNVQKKIGSVISIFIGKVQIHLLNVFPMNFMNKILKPLNYVKTITKLVEDIGKLLVTNAKVELSTIQLDCYAQVSNFGSLEM